MNSTRMVVHGALRRAGLHIGRYPNSIPARRTRILRHYGVGLVVDVGANVGQYGTELRRHGYTGQILSLEPSAQAYDQLVAVTAGDERWACRRVAAGAEPGHARLNISHESIFNSMLPILAESVSASAAAAVVGCEEVEVDTLDRILAQAQARDLPLALKIDVQGFERDVLDGSVQTLQAARVVEMEFSPEPVYGGDQILLEEVMHRMRAAGLVLSLVENLFQDYESGRSLQFNGIFVRAGRGGVEAG